MSLTSTLFPVRAAGTDMSAYKLVFYDGRMNPAVEYTTPFPVPLTGTLQDQQNGYGTLGLSYGSGSISDGPNGAVALYRGSEVRPHGLTLAVDCCQCRPSCA